MDVEKKKVKPSYHVVCNKVFFETKNRTTIKIWTCPKCGCIGRRRHAYIAGTQLPYIGECKGQLLLFPNQPTYLRMI